MYKISPSIMKYNMLSCVHDILSLCVYLDYEICGLSDNRRSALSITFMISSSGTPDYYTM